MKKSFIKSERTSRHDWNIVYWDGESQFEKQQSNTDYIKVKTVIFRKSNSNMKLNDLRKIICLRKI